MSNFRRYFVAGGTYFFTVVTFERLPFLTQDLARRLLRESILDVKQRRPFEVVAWALLPDHFHAIWTLPHGDADYSTRWSQIKEGFTKRWLAEDGVEGYCNRSRRHRRERAVWQRRFWEHTVTDEEDLDRCVDYVHWNPVKHGHVKRVRDWEWSTFHRFVSAGHYDIDWGGSDPCPTYGRQFE